MMPIDDRTTLIGKAIKYGRKQRLDQKQDIVQLREELVKRQKGKEQEKNLKLRRSIVKVLKSENFKDSTMFPDYDFTQPELDVILNSKLSGKRILHYRFEDGQKKLYNGLVKKLYATAKYKTSYWNDAETFDDAVDFSVSKYEMAVDFLMGDLLLCD